MKEPKYFYNQVEEYFTTSDGIKIHTIRNFEKYEKSSRPLLVFNYGLVCNHEHWKHQLPYFDKKEFQILIHDYRFHHKSSFKGDIANCTFKNIVTDLDLILEAIDAEKVIMLGHSMGVNICLEFAREFPEKTAGVVLISGTSVPPQGVMFDSNITEIVSPYLKLIQEKYPTAFNSFWSNSHKSEIVQKIILRGGFNTKTVPQEFVEVYLKKMGELPHNIFLHLLQEMHDQDILTHLEDMNLPTLVIGGDMDKVIPNYLQFILSNTIPNAELYIIKDGSHVPQVDFPNYVNDRVLRFFEKNGF